MSRRLWLMVLVLILGMARIAAADSPIVINMIVDPQTVLFYVGGDLGIKVGDVFDVTRDGVSVGQVRAKKVGAQFTYATVLSGTLREMDVVVKSASAPVVTAPPVEEKKVEVVRETPPAEPVEEVKPPTVKVEEKLQVPVKVETLPPPVEPEKKPGKHSKQPKAPKEPKGPKAEKPMATHASIIGLSGVVYTPTAIATPQGSGAVQLGWLSATNEKLQYNDLLFGVNYGVSKDIELGASYINTKPTNDIATSTLKTMVLAFKYSLPNGISKGNPKEKSTVVYAVGAYYFRQQGYTPPNTTGGGQYSATRAFGAMTMKMDKGGTMSLTAYMQNGVMVRDTGYDGFGFAASYEQPFGLGGKISDKEQMTLVTEYDTKALYVGIRNCWTLGMRYRLGGRMYIGVSVVGLARANAPFIGGGASF